MDPLTIGVGALMTVLTIGGGFIFARQEGRIGALEDKLEELVHEHIACRTKNAALQVEVNTLRVANDRLQGEVNALKTELHEMKART